MTEEKKPMKIVFAPGSLDQFDGTQEELDEMIAEIQRMADSGELETNAISLEDMDFEDDPELQEALEDVIKTLIQSENRTLH